MTGKNRIVFRVWADPEPDDGVAFAHAQCAPPNSNANRINGIDWMNAFEVKAGMERIVCPKVESFESLASHRRG